MPKYNFTCLECGATKIRILQNPLRKLHPEDQAAIKECEKCAAQMKLDGANPSASVVETLDNGLMTRRVERPAEAERLFKERAASDPRNKR